MTLSDTSRNLTFANRFWIFSSGQLKAANHAALFTDGKSHLHFQIANTPIQSVFGQAPRFADLPPEIKRDSERRTRGWFRSCMEARILPANTYDVTADFFDPFGEEDLNKRFRIIDGHEAWGAAHYYFGVCDNGMPKSWNAMAAFSYRVTVEFDWNNGREPCWSFRCSPRAEPGHTRACYADARWNAVDLLDQPESLKKP